MFWHSLLYPQLDVILTGLIMLNDNNCYITPTVARQKNMVMSSAKPGTKNDCAGEAKSNLPETDLIFLRMSEYMLNTSIFI
jgi:hypothetical protein